VEYMTLSLCSDECRRSRDEAKGCIVGVWEVGRNTDQPQERAMQSINLGDRIRVITQGGKWQGGLPYLVEWPGVVKTAIPHLVDCTFGSSLIRTSGVGCYGLDRPTPYTGLGRDN
jgi:hypothetical protein